MSEATVEFWFKLEDETSYYDNTRLFSMKHTIAGLNIDETIEDYYFEIYI